MNLGENGVFNTPLLFSRTGDSDVGKSQSIRITEPEIPRCLPKNSRNGRNFLSTIIPLGAKYLIFSQGVSPKLTPPRNIQGPMTSAHRVWSGHQAPGEPPQKVRPKTTPERFPERVEYFI